MANQKPNQHSIRTTEDLVKNNLISPSKQTALDPVAEQFSIAITPNMLSAIKTYDDSDPIYKQFVPTTQELHSTTQELSDPIADAAHSPVKGVVHRHPDRCLFMPVKVCPVYCRFCFRREKVGRGSESLNSEELEQAYNYIESHPEIWEVILTGGDPLILKPHQLASIINRLNSIQSVEVIRIHTRVPIVDPSRVTDDFIQSIKLPHKPVYIVLHSNHANEFTAETIEAVKKIADAGIPMLSQSVLLKGINDNIAALSELMRTFIRHKIKPYYLHHADLTKGTSHFRTSIEAGQALMRELRANFSGICQPEYVLDIPGGYGKVPVHESYIQTTHATGNNEIIDLKGRRHDIKMEDQNLNL